MDFQFTQRDWNLQSCYMSRQTSLEWNFSYQHFSITSTKFTANQHLHYWLARNLIVTWKKLISVEEYSIFFKEKDKVHNINVVFGFRPTTLNCGRKDVIKYIWVLTCDFLYKYQPYQQPGQWKSCPGTSRLFIIWKCLCVC